MSVITQIKRAAAAVLPVSSMDPAERRASLQTELDAATSKVLAARDDLAASWLELELEEAPDRTEAAEKALAVAEVQFNRAQARLQALDKAQAQRVALLTAQRHVDGWRAARTHAQAAAAAADRLEQHLVAAGEAMAELLKAADAAHVSMPSGKSPAVAYRLDQSGLRAAVDIRLQRSGLVRNQQGSLLAGYPELRSVLADAVVLVAGAARGAGAGE